MRVFEHPPKWLQRCLVVAWLVPRETAAVSVQVLCTSLQCHVIRSHIRRMHVRLAATCHLHYRQNDRDLLRAAAVTREWNGYRNKSQHRQLTMEKKIILPFLPELELETFYQESVVQP